MKTDMLIPLLVLSVFGVSAQYRTQRSRVVNPSEYSSSQAYFDLMAKRSRKDITILRPTHKHLRLLTLLDILDRTASSAHGGPIHADRYSLVFEGQREKKRACDTRRITLATIIEYLKSGRICGFRVSTFRFGLGGKKR